MKLANLINLKEETAGAFGMSAEDLAATHSLKALKNLKDELFADQNNEAGRMDPDEFERLGRHQYYGGQLNGVDAAIALKEPKKDKPYDVAVGNMTQDEYDEYMDTVVSKDQFNQSSEFDRGIGEGKIGANSWKTRTAVVTAPGVTEDKEIIIDNIDDLNNVTIRWRGANHWGNKTLTNLKFEKENEFDDDLMAISNDSKWLFIVDLDEETGEVDWDTLMVDSRELENVADDGTSTYSVPDEDMINEATRFQQLAGIKPLYENEERKVDNSSLEFDNYTDDGSIPLPTAGWWEDGTEMSEDELEAYYDKMGDSTMHSIMSDNLGEGNLKEQDRKADHSSFEFDNYTDDGSIPLPTAGWWEDDGSEMTDDELEDYYEKMGDSTMHTIMHDNLGEGTCGHGPNGVLGDTPGGTKGMDADDRTRGMLKKLIQKEIKKLHETDYADRLANSGTDSKGLDTWGHKTGYSDEEMKKGKGELKTYPDKYGRNVWGDKTDYSELQILIAQGEKMAAFADKQSGYEGGIDSPVRNVLTAMKVAGGPGFDGDVDMIDYYTRKLSKAIKIQKEINKLHEKK